MAEISLKLDRLAEIDDAAQFREIRTSQTLKLFIYCDGFYFKTFKSRRNIW